MGKTEAYQETVRRLEPDIHPIDPDGAAASIAISLKRIADAVEKIIAISEAEKKQEPPRG